MKRSLSLRVVERYEKAGMFPMADETTGYAVYLSMIIHAGSLHVTVRFCCFRVIPHYTTRTPDCILKLWTGRRSRPTETTAL